jgi:hypothetical protein
MKPFAGVTLSGPSFSLSLCSICLLWLGCCWDGERRERAAPTFTAVLIVCLPNIGKDSREEREKDETLESKMIENVYT